MRVRTAPHWAAAAVLLVTALAAADPQGPAAAGTARPPVDRLHALLRTDPQEFLRVCRDSAAVQFPKYRCRFIKDERINGKLTGQQTIEVCYRHEPRSVLMTWIDNPVGAQRLLWIRGSGSGGEQVRVEPSGVAGFFVSNLELSISDKRVQAASRRPVSDFGFYATLDYLVRDNAAAAAAGTLELRYAGEGTIDGRATYVLERHLPYNGAEGPYPDARTVLHVDQEWLVPLQIWSYADRQEHILLERYHLGQIRLEPGLSDADFSL